MELAYCTNQELIEELIHRKSFIGLILHSQDEHRIENQCHTNFKVVTNLEDQIALTMICQLQELISNNET